MYIIYINNTLPLATDLYMKLYTELGRLWSVHKLFTRCIRTACSELVRTSLEQAVDKLGTSSANTSC